MPKHAAVVDSRLVEVPPPPMPGAAGDARGDALAAAYRALERANERYRQLFELGPIGIAILDSDANLREVNRALCNLLGQPSLVLMGQPLKLLVVHEDRTVVARALAVAARTGTARCEVSLLACDGRPMACELAVSWHGIGDTVQISVTDLSAQRRAERTLREAHDSMRHLAYHDPLTALPNRLLFSDRLEQSLLRARRRLGKVALLFLDIDRFKQINDRLGHAAGDRVLCEFAHRVRASVRKDDTVARLSGDEFAAVLENIDTLAQAREVALKIRAALSRPLRIDGEPVALMASVGIALYPDDATTSIALLEHADKDMFRRKRAGAPAGR